MSTKLSEKPIRIAVLGGSCTGKTAFISRLTIDIVHEVHYPTREQTNWLFTYNPHDPVARAILDERAHERCYYNNNNSIEEAVFKTPNIKDDVLLSPLIYQSFIEDYHHIRSSVESGQRSFDQKLLLKSDNPYYQYVPKSDDTTRKRANRRASIGFHMTDISLKHENKQVLPSVYEPPRYTDILIDIIDTPGFNPDMIVPFLEVSLFSNLDKSVLRGLADQPRTPVSTQSMLVASGASELNGMIDGYIIVYSAIPELNHPDPPDYGSSSSAHHDQNKSIGKTPSPLYNEEKLKSTLIKNDLTTDSSDGGFSLLHAIRSCFLDAWTEFRNYQRRWIQRNESDAYSLNYIFKHSWKSEQDYNQKIKALSLFNAPVDQIDLNPESPDSPPPILIVCTHIMDPLHSPMLVDWGKKLAVEWNCGFVALDSMVDVNVDIAMSCMIRDIVEKEKLSKKHSTKKKSVLQKIIKG
ncbi:uncharacterized protein Ecym_3437 [Eremothecium cymbalariae DBVPG|uniref:Uncharacterized protein n=1 Tax=Eremothecium cymbalariae (strain CBS 270.75 / DBVPG 7215 / KCTC 17166 / NRRL Y-17582) TaxID=931890 RepID=G8JS03_ERECY|nr:Hypothetical protein Ecym_3437 [Eremothecium cymbalariae DBVPG\